MKKFLLLIISHAVVGAIGFAGGIYMLPILIAPPAPAEAEVLEIASQAQFTSEFRRDLAGSDALHWGEGGVSVSRSAVSLMGKLAPGPDRTFRAPVFTTPTASSRADVTELEENWYEFGAPLLISGCARTWAGIPTTIANNTIAIQNFRCDRIFIGFTPCLIQLKYY